ncbi:MAG: hypothetical protein IPN17_36095 [Deltaproteobacteria bacterium]|nr:hypothetical protein [Deltaproteobacteria bacterium]
MTNPDPTRLSRSQRGVMALITSPRRLLRFLRDPAAPKLPKAMAVLAVLYVVMLRPTSSPTCCRSWGGSTTWG